MWILLLFVIICYFPGWNKGLCLMSITKLHNRVSSLTTYLKVPCSVWICRLWPMSQTTYSSCGLPGGSAIILLILLDIERNVDKNPYIQNVSLQFNEICLKANLCKHTYSEPFHINVNPIQYERTHHQTYCLEHQPGTYSITTHNNVIKI